MNQAPPSPQQKPRAATARAPLRRKAGMVLVIMLAMIVLTTVAVMAFFAHASAEKQVENSRAERTEATLLASSGEDYTLALIRSEIIDTANSKAAVSGTGPTIYLPKAGTNLMPQRVIGTGIAQANSNYFNLVRQSIGSADGHASTHSSASASRNGRLVDTNRWNAPQLLAGGGFAAGNQLPNWIYVTRNGGLTNMPGTNVIGRFAYNVYNIATLLNANVAGYPSSLTAAQINTLKGTPAGADLTQLGVSQNAIDKLIAFRNPSSKSAQDYIDNILDAQRAGFLFIGATNASGAPVYTNNVFVNRQDLLRYVRTQNPALTNALPYLTQYSVAVNAPAWTPVNPPGLDTSRKNYEANAEDSAYVNRNIPNVRFTGKASVNYYHDDGTFVTQEQNAGDALIQRKFSLAKLKWLGMDGPNEAAFASTVDDNEQRIAIQQCFGLAWNDGQARWDYVGPSGSSVQTSIATLAQAAADNRAPNFFELLKAGILSGSVGSGALDATLPVCATMAVDDSAFQANSDLQLLKIGANIIDCADADNQPTIIGLSFGGTTVESAGTEDLPYLYSLSLVTMRDVTVSGTTYTMNRTHVVCVPEFINPYRPSSSSAGYTPDSVTLEVISGSLTRSRCIIGGYWRDLKNLNRYLPAVPSIATGVTIPSSKFGDFRLTAMPNDDPGASNRLGALVPYATASVNAQTFLLVSYEVDDPNWAPFKFSKSSNASIYLQISNWVLRMTYLTASGKTKTYATYGGRESLTSMTGLQGSTQTWNSSGPNFVTTPNMGELGWTTLKTATQIVPWDPRSQRFGMGTGYTRNVGDPPGTGANPDLVRFCLPFTTSYGWNTKFPLAGWLQGNKSGPPNPIPASPVLNANVRDADGVMRPADGWLDANGSANPYRQTSSSTALNATHASRPIILQRSYQSVAELGYVFRDSPWKSLSFFDETSGDSALLDLFSITEEPALTAGDVALSTPHPAVQRALLSGIATEPDGSQPLTNPGKIAEICNAYAYQNGIPAATMPMNTASLAALLSQNESAMTGAGMDFIKWHREAIVRALAGTTQTRTWNLFVDLIAQTGRFMPNGSNVGDFVVEGEERRWLSTAIDRYTAQVVSRQSEIVNE